MSCFYFEHNTIYVNTTCMIAMKPKTIHCSNLFGNCMTGSDVKVKWKVNYNCNDASFTGASKKI